MTKDDDFRKKIKSQIKDNDCYDLLRVLFTRICAPEGVTKLKVFCGKLPQATSAKLMNLIYTKNVVLSDGEHAVRKVYKIKTLREMIKDPPATNIAHTTS